MTTINTNTSATTAFIVTPDTTGTFVVNTGSGVGATAMTISSSQNTTFTGNVVGVLKSGTATAASSGTSISFTGIPSTAKRITVMFNEVSLSGTDNILVQIGDAGGVETTGYISSSTGFSGASGGTVSSTTGFIVASTLAAYINSGALVLTLVGANLWVASGAGKLATSACWVAGGSKTLSDTLTQINITRTGTDTFDGAGTINIMWE